MKTFASLCCLVGTLIAGSGACAQVAVQAAADPQALLDPKDATKKYSTTWFDMFRIENGKIAGHWDPAQKQ